MIERLACPVCGAPLVNCEHIRSVGYQNGQIVHIKLHGKPRTKILRRDIPRIVTAFPKVETVLLAAKEATP